MEKQVFRTRKNYESLFNSAPIPIIVVHDDRIVFHNAETETLFGYRPDELESTPVAHFIHPDDLAGVLQDLRKQSQGNLPTGIFSFRVKTRSGDNRRVDLKSSAFLWDDRPAVLGFIIDTTERLNMEAALRQSETQYRELVQSLNIVIMKADSRFNFTFLNRFGQTFFGYSEAEVLGKNILETITPDVEKSTGRDMGMWLEEMINHPDKYNDNENENRRKDGRQVWVSWRNTPVFDDSGKLVEFMCTGFDITDRMAAEEQLRRKTAELNERIKEMNCLYGMGELVERTDITLDGIYSGAIDLISQAMQYPEVTHSRIVFQDGKEIISPHGELPVLEKWSIRADIKNQGQTIGHLVVFYSEERPAGDIGPFLKEEQQLVKTLAEKLGRTIESHRLKAALVKSEARHKIIFDNSPIAMFVAQDGKTTFLNPAKRKLNGFTANENGNESGDFADVVHQDDLEMVRERHFKRLRGEPVSNEVTYRIINQSGDIRWLDTRVIPFDWENRPAALCFQTDITDRRKAEEKIRIQQKKLETVYQQMTEELEQARLVQLALLPAEPPELPDLKLAVKYHPMAQIGGDFYDLVTDDPGSLGILVGDVTGHGIPAALLSFLYLTTFKNSRSSFSPPDAFMQLSNAFLAGKLPGGKYATMFYCHYDLGKKVLTYTSAGHPPGYLIRPGAEKLIQLQTSGMVVGMFEKPRLPFESKSIALQPGDKVLVYTDGMLEVTNGKGEMLDGEKLEAFLLTHSRQPVDQLLEAIYQFCFDFSNHRGFNDDVTMIALEVV